MPKYHWVAYYKNGEAVSPLTHKKPNNPDLPISYDDLKREDLIAFALFEGSVKEHRLIFMLHLDPGQRLIYRRRVEIHQSSQQEIVCHLLGWQQTIQGKNVQSIAYIFETNDTPIIHLAGRFREGESGIFSWFYSPVLRDFEKPKEE